MSTKPKHQPKTEAPAVSPTWPEILTTKQAAAYLGKTLHTLEKWRVITGKGTPIGPPFVLPPGSRPFYRRSDLDRWIDANLKAEVAA